MKKYPFIKQDAIHDCGCACINMIINYYKGNLPIEEIRQLTKTNKNGTTAFHIIQACRQIGFEANGIKTKLDNIKKENIILPCLAHVIINEKYKHFIVIYEINFKKKTLVVADPASNLKKITFNEFEKIWDEILIILYPIKKLPLSRNISLNSFILNIIKMHKKLIINMLILSFFVTIFSIINSFYLKYIFDGINYNKNYLLMLFIFFLVISLFRIISDFFRNKLLIYLNQKIDLSITLETFKKIILLPYNYYHSRTTGDIISRLNDLSIIRNMISKVALELFIDLPLTLISLIVLYLINVKLFTISLIILILYLLVIISFKKIIQNIINKIQISKAETTSYMIESVSGFETVKSLGNQNKIINTFEKKYVNLLNNTFKYDNYNNIIYVLKELINKVGYLLIVFIGSNMVASNEIELGTLLVFTTLLNYFLEPMRYIIDLDSEIKEARNTLKRILELSINENKKIGFLEKIEGKKIEIKKLNYTYDDKSLILKNVNITLNKEKVLILGNSGSGKTTLLKLIMKYFDTSRNQIFIDSNDINDYKIETVNEYISYISQNEILYTDSIYNNLKINNNVTNEQILEVSKLCFINEFLNDLGLNMLIEENGYNISGGQRQRIFLARALLKDFKILMIDEGLSQMDINLERKILKNIFEKYKDKMIIVVSHRLDNMDLYDRVIEMKNGQVIKDVMKNG